FPFFCVSIALEKEGVVELGVIYDPTRDDLFFACRKGGAYLNGKKLHVSPVSDFQRSLFATGFPYDIRVSPDNNLNFFSAMALKAQAIRRAGAAALDLAYLAAGRFDGFWELKLKPWDTAAGCLLVTEAGGVISDMTNGKWNLYSPGLVASNGLIHDQMLSVLRKKQDASS
ncbi:MAG: inositol monophosphatase family protein, partial [Smithella sp.]